MRLLIDHRAVNISTGAVSIEGRNEPLVVLLHGAGMNRSVWYHQTRFLAHQGYRAMAPDFPGHGGSDGPALDSIGALADWVYLLGELLDDQMHLIGHSMGALVALDAASRYQDSVASILLLGVAARMPVHPDLQTAAENDDPLAAALIASWAHARQQQISPHPTPGLSMLGGAKAVIESAPPGVLATDLRSCAAYENAVQNAAATNCPVTMVLGVEDRMTPIKGSEPLEEAFTVPPKVLKVPASGHMLMQERPDVIRQAILDHLTID